MDRVKKKGAIITSVVLGVVSMILMGLAKKTVFKMPFVKHVLKVKNIGLDSMKDFLEISELNLRIDAIAHSTTDAYRAEVIYDGIPIKWDSDDSTSYTIFVSPEPIVKHKLFDSDSIPFLEDEEVESLKTSSTWIRKIVLGKDTSKSADKKDIPPFFQQSPRKDKEEEYDADNPETYFNPDSDRTEFYTNNVRTDYRLPFTQFYCRIRSSNGRVSKELEYPGRNVTPLKKSELNTRIFKRGLDYYIQLEKNDSSKTSPIVDCQAILYVSDGKGRIINLPEIKTSIVAKLGQLPPCLCYVKGVYRAGLSFEQFVSWIGESSSLTLDGALD